MVSYNLLNVPDELWEKFKKTVNKSQTMSDAIIELIKKEVESKK